MSSVQTTRFREVLLKQVFSFTQSSGFAYGRFLYSNHVSEFNSTKKVDHWGGYHPYISLDIPIY